MEETEAERGMHVTLIFMLALVILNTHVEVYVIMVMLMFSFGAVILRFTMMSMRVTVNE